ncbi:MAG: CehA/McbA family metallohydrolase [Planctomycetota bacterium]
MLPTLLFVAAATLGPAPQAAPQERPGRVLDAALHHLGNDPTPEWPEAPLQPEGTKLEVRFESAANAGEWMLYLRQRSIDNVWRLRMNGAEFAQLRTGGDFVERWYALPAGLVKSGANLLEVVPDTPSDDIVVGDVRLVERSVRDVFRLQKLAVRVSDVRDGSALPARVSFVDANGQRPPLFFAKPAATATRDGVLYLDGAAELELPRGTYRTFATRGPEWSLSESVLTLDEAPASISFTLASEVDTRGFMACDTHLHTLQFSGHGDASALERQVTLAGEGVELAIATDHNHNIDYAPFQRELGLSKWYTSVVGNEVTTDIGHFNAFPLSPADPVPPFRSRDIVTIVQGIRGLGAQVVILNHPRWPSATNSPFGHHQLDRVLGRFDPPLELPVDATEMLNSTTEEKDPLGLFRDWFALLNRGVRIFAVGSSDSHTVGEPVGQGRTYVPCASEDAATIDVAAACAAIREGRTSISQGFVATALASGKPVMGVTLDRSTGFEPVTLELRVQAAHWLRPRKATAFANGRAIATQSIPSETDKPLDVTLRFDLALRERNDAWVVFLVEGDAIATPAWPAVNPYTLAATNPVFIDRDGGGYTSPGAAASAFVPKATPDTLRTRFAELDGPHAVQLAAAWLALERGRGVPHVKALERVRELLGERATTDADLVELLAR